MKARNKALETRLDQLEGEMEESNATIKRLLEEKANISTSLNEVEVALEDARKTIGDKLVPHHQVLESQLRDIKTEKKDLLERIRLLEQERSSQAKDLEVLKAGYSDPAQRADAAALLEQIKKESEALQHRLADAETKDHKIVDASQQRLQELENAVAQQTARSETLQRDLNIKVSQTCKLFHSFFF